VCAWCESICWCLKTRKPAEAGSRKCLRGSLPIAVLFVAFDVIFFEIEVEVVLFFVVRTEVPVLIVHGVTLES